MGKVMLIGFSRKGVFNVRKGGRRLLFVILPTALCGLTNTTLSRALTAEGVSLGRPQRPSKPNAAAKVPPFHAHPPQGPLPQVLPWQEFVGNLLAGNAYFFAARIRSVLYQQPCYCPCGRDLGHTCLLDCFTRPDKHAAVCATCIKEAIFAYEQTERGVTARVIRSEIMKGEWAKVDLTKYNQPPAR